MGIIAKLVIVGLGCYTVGTFVGPVAVGSVTEARETLSPFLILSAAILIASIGYAVGAIRRSPFVGRDPRERFYE